MKIKLTGARKLDDLATQLETQFTKVPTFVMVTGYTNAAGGHVTLTHTLGIKPDMMVPVGRGVGVDIYATDEERKLWDDKRVVFISAAANTKVDVLLLKF